MALYFGVVFKPVVSGDQIMTLKNFCLVGEKNVIHIVSHTSLWIILSCGDGWMDGKPHEWMGGGWEGGQMNGTLHK